MINGCSPPNYIPCLPRPPRVVPRVDGVAEPRAPLPIPNLLVPDLIPVDVGFAVAAAAALSFASCALSRSACCSAARCLIDSASRRRRSSPSIRNLSSSSASWTSYSAGMRASATGRRRKPGLLTSFRPVHRLSSMRRCVCSV